MSTVTGSVNSLGIGSGLNANSIIQSLIAADSAPLTTMQTQAQTLNTQISDVGQVKSLAATLQTAAQALGSSSLWTQTTSTSSDSTVVTASTASGTAPPGDYQVSVQQLAQGQTVTSATMSSTATVMDTGSITIQLGQWSGNPPNAFTAQSGSNPTTITIGAGATSLSSVRDAINAANAGVTASIVTDASGSRLSLRSTTTGATNGFKVTTTDNNDAGTTNSLSSLNYDPSSNNAALSLDQSAQNAQATINGIAVTSGTNTLSNVSDGLNLTLGRVSTTPVDVQVSVDKQAQTSAVNTFVSAYNALNSYISQQTAYDQATSTAAPLMGDASVIGFQNQLRSLVDSTSTASSQFGTLTDLGITVQTDGSLSVNTTTLGNALSNPAEMQKFWSNNPATSTGTDLGFGVSFSNLTTQALDPISGGLTNDYTGLQAQLTRNQSDQAAFQTHLNDEQARLTAQYQTLDTTMSQMNALSSYVTQQMAMLPHY